MGKKADPEAGAKARAKKVKGVEIEGASDMGGLAFFCTTLMEPDGDMADLQLVCNMPEDLQVDKEMDDGKTRKAMFADKWVQHVLDNFAKESPGLKAEGDANFAKASIPANKDIGFFPLKFKDDAMSFAYGLLRTNNCFKDDAS